MSTMTKNEVLRELSRMGSEQTKKTRMLHGACEALLSVKLGDMKKYRQKGEERPRSFPRALFHWQLRCNVPCRPNCRRKEDIEKRPGRMVKNCLRRHRRVHRALGRC